MYQNDFLIRKDVNIAKADTCLGNHWGAVPSEPFVVGLTLVSIMQSDDLANFQHMALPQISTRIQFSMCLSLSEQSSCW